MMGPAVSCTRTRFGNGPGSWSGWVWAAGPPPPTASFRGGPAAARQAPLTTWLACARRITRRPLSAGRRAAAQPPLAVSSWPSVPPHPPLLVRAHCRRQTSTTRAPLGFVFLFGEQQGGVVLLPLPTSDLASTVRAAVGQAPPSTGLLAARCGGGVLLASGGGSVGRGGCCGGGGGGPMARDRPPARFDVRARATTPATVVGGRASVSRRIPRPSAPGPARCVA